MRMEATPGFEPGVRILQTLALPLGDVADKKNGAGNGTRTRDNYLGKVALYHLSYSRPSKQSKSYFPTIPCQ